MHALTEVHVLSQTLAAVFQVDTQEHLVSKLLLGLSETCIQLAHKNNRVLRREKTWPHTEPDESWQIKSSTCLLENY